LTGGGRGRVISSGNHRGLSLILTPMGVRRDLETCPGMMSSLIMMRRNPLARVAISGAHLSAFAVSYRVETRKT